jgi:nucleoid-associated protein YgaU
MAMIDAEPGVGRVQRAGAGRMRVAAPDAPRNGSVAGSGGRQPEISLLPRVTRQRVVACGRPRESREWGRLLLAGLFACLVVVLVGLFALRAMGSAPPSRTVVVRVTPGDTLWSLAHRFAPHGDPRAIVQRIVELNSLDGAKLQIGQPLAVPAEAE